MATTKMLATSLFRNISVRNNVFRRVHNHVSAKYSQTISNLPEIKVTTLQNGLRVASSQSDSPTATIGVWIDSGSRYETPETNGVANFVEHLLLKGNSPQSRENIENQVRALGARFYAETGREKTKFFAECLSSDASKIVEILGTALQNTDFDNGQVETERKVILAELEDMQSTNMKQVVFDYLHSVAYQGTPLGWSVYGPTANINKITKNDIANYVKNNFSPARIVLAASGNVKHDDLVKLAEKHLGSLSNDGHTTTRSVCRFTGSEVRARDDWMPFAHVAIAVDTCGADNPDIISLTLAKLIIGSWDKTCLSSANTTNVLVQNIYKEARCHGFESFHDIYHDTGLWGCYFVLDKMVLDDFMFNLQNEWMKLCINVSETELAIAKNKLRSELVQRLSNTTSHCNDIGHQILDLKQPIQFVDVDGALSSIFIDHFKETCHKYIYDRCPALGAIGPVEGLTDYVRIRGNMYWLRY